jgi:CheY-like chemotaxis protein
VEPSGRGKRVLVVEDDSAIAEVLQALLKDEGYEVSVLRSLDPDAIRTAVGKIEPDCVVLDGQSPHGYGSSWGEAAWLRGRSRLVPAVMLTGHAAEIEEARQGSSSRSRAAGFNGVLAKPFELDVLSDAVAAATGASVPFDGSAAADATRTAKLCARLRAAGLTEVETSTQREWASFTANRRRWLLYWSQGEGVYFLVRNRPGASGHEQVGRFYDLDAAVEVAGAVGAAD